MCMACRRQLSFRSRAALATDASLSAGGRPRVVLGRGDHRYAVAEHWYELPDGMTFVDVAGVAVDSRDRVYVLTRGEHPVTVFDRDGKFIEAWGHDIGFARPHGASIGPDDALYITDDAGHTVRKCSTDGKLLMTIGVPGQPAPSLSGEPFNRCTHTALSPRGDIYVSDGYSNARVHKYDPAGNLLLSWGESGTGPGQFNTVHNIACDDDGWVYVADRENQRVQVFDPDGRYETQWMNLGRVCALFVGRGSDPLVYVGELPPFNVAGLMRHARNLGPRVTVLNTRGEILSHVGEEPMGESVGQFLAPHGISVDSKGDVYVAEVANTYWPVLFGESPGYELRCFQKLVHLGAETGKGAQNA